MIVDYIKKMFENSFKKEWYETYWAIDLHGTILTPTYKDPKSIGKFYPYAKETLQLLTKRPDIKLIMWTSSFPEEILRYENELSSHGIKFDAVNKNPQISSRNGNFGYYEDKFYFNVLIDDKAGFDPHVEWKQIYDYLIECEKNNYLPNPEWTTKY